jgi:hypothetical protein
MDTTALGQVYIVIEKCGAGIRVDLCGERDRRMSDTGLPDEDARRSMIEIHQQS